MKEIPINRRRFLVASIAFSGLFTSTAGLSVFRFGKAWAQSIDIEDLTHGTMLRVARLLYPHDAISDDVYREVLDQALADTAVDGAIAGALREVEDALNSQQNADYMTLDEDTQIAAMMAIEHMEAFTDIQIAVRARLYKHPAIWALLGYEGPSYQQGGYLNRGAGVIDWLPETE